MALPTDDELDETTRDTVLFMSWQYGPARTESVLNELLQAGYHEPQQLNYMLTTMLARPDGALFPEPPWRSS